MSSVEKIVQGICNLCIINCGMQLTIRDNQLVKVEPISGSIYRTLCPRGLALREWLYSKEHIPYPMKRVNNEWRRITWGEALSTISTKLEDIKEKFGARAVAIAAADMNSGADWLARRFANVYGTPNFSASGGPFCEIGKRLAAWLTYGYYPEAHLPSTHCLVLWGANPEDSSPTVKYAYEGIYKKQGKLLVVDPRTTDFAKQANVHAKVRPGTDGAFALGLINVIISEGLYDKEFIKKWTVGFDRLVEVAKDYFPEKVEKITWVPAHEIREFARIYATTRPATIRYGVSVEHSTNQFQSARAALFLPALTGNLEVEGGHVRPGPLPKIAHTWQVRDLADKAVGQDEFPLYYKYVYEWISGHDANFARLPEVMLTEKPYPIKAFVAVGGNAATQWPNTNKVKEALAKVDFMMVKDFYMTETAKLAHIFLPTASYLEQQYFSWSAYYGGVTRIALFDKYLEPPEERWTDSRFWLELAKMMGYGEYFPWQDQEAFNEDIMKQMGTTAKEVLSLGAKGFYYAPRKFGQYKSEGFPTPSGKVEFYAERILKGGKEGYDPLLTYEEPAESVVSRPDLAKEYPLILTTGGRSMLYTHSRYRYIESIRKLRDPDIEINTEDAKKYGIKNGATVVVSSPRGSTKVKAVVTGNIIPGVVHMISGWPDGCNVLTDDTALDAYSGVPGFRSSLCKISAA
jgi:anaerobic selenocysteine-containing dehydrogenase